MAWITFLIILLSLIFILVLIALFILLQRTARAGKAIPPAEPASLASVNGLDAAASLAEVIQCQTISFDGKKPSGANAFNELHGILEKNYPLIHAKLQRRKINQYSLLYYWPGKQPALEPILLAAHQDVVPVEQSSLDQWQYPPFSGAIADGFVWGRGAMDMKSQLTSVLDAVEYLLKREFQPERGIYVAFGHDEEIGGTRGACEIVKTLQQEGVRLAAVIDEGGGVVHDAFPDIHTPLALIGTSEKGSLTLELSVESPPGHSSAPPEHTTIGILAGGLANLEARQMPARLTHAKPILEAVAGKVSFAMRMAFSNLWLFGGMIRRSLEKNPQTNAMLRTTTAITMIEGGIKVNILPSRAAAKVNYRLAPMDTIEDVIQHTRTSVADPRIKITRPKEGGRLASSISPADSIPYHLLSQTIRQVFDEIPVAPFLVTGGTDARYYTQICENVYRFTPVIATRDDMGRVHGIGERISLQNLEKMILFFIQLIQTWSSDHGSAH